MKEKLIPHFNQYILQLYQIYKYLQEKVRTGLLFPPFIMLLVFQSIILYLEAVILNYRENWTIQEKP